MRKDAKRKDIQVSTEQIQSYHGYQRDVESEHGDYALDGFGELYYWTSDRHVKIDLAKRIAGYGFEIETESRYAFDRWQKAQIYRNIILSDFNPNFFKMQEDGSLRNHGVECITGIATKEFIRNHYAEFRAMWDKMQKMQCSPKIDNQTNCGMHTNISISLFGKTEKSQAQKLAMLYRLINHNFNFFCHLFMRDTDKTGYCCKLPDIDISVLKNYNTLAKVMELGEGHGVCLNFSHLCERNENSRRMEIRLVGPQEKYFNFRNTCECIFHIMDFLNNRATWSNIDDLEEVFKGANGYVKQRLKDFRPELANVCTNEKPYELQNNM